MSVEQATVELLEIEDGGMLLIGENAIIEKDLP